MGKLYGYTDEEPEYLDDYSPEPETPADALYALVDELCSDFYRKLCHKECLPFRVDVGKVIDEFPFKADVAEVGGSILYVMKQHGKVGLAVQMIGPDELLPRIRQSDFADELRAAFLQENVRHEVIRRILRFGVNCLYRTNRGWLLLHNEKPLEYTPDHLRDSVNDALGRVPAKLCLGLTFGNSTVLSGVSDACKNLLAGPAIPQVDYRRIRNEYAQRLQADSKYNECLLWAIQEAVASALPKMNTDLHDECVNAIAVELQHGSLRAFVRESLVDYLLDLAHW